MTSFSSILDISSFFIGVLVNLLLVAMICFYFKRKIDNLELSQSEQAKMLFKLLQDQNNAMMAQPSMQQEPGQPSYAMLHGLDLTQLNTNEDISDDESSDNESDDSDSDNENEVENEEVQTKTIDYEEIASEPTEPSAESFARMTVKELKTYLEDRGYTTRNLKKQELIDLVMLYEKEQSQSIASVVKVMEEGVNEIQDQDQEVDEPEPEEVVAEVDVSDEVELSNDEIVDIEW